MEYAVKKILVVDDSSTARSQIRNALSPGGYEIIEAVSGEEGLLKLGAHRDTAVVLCDVNMPGLGGLDMLKAMPEALRSGMAFLMLTSDSDPRLVQIAKAFGAKGWIVKPFKPDVLLATVQKFAA